MAGYLFQRLWQTLLVLLAVSVLSFVLIFLSGDPVAALIPLNARQEDVENIRIQSLPSTMFGCYSRPRVTKPSVNAQVSNRQMWERTHQPPDDRLVINA